MPASPAVAVCACAAELNALIRAHCAGRAVWSRADLAELARLQAAYVQAARVEAVLRPGELAPAA